MKQSKVFLFIIILFQAVTISACTSNVGVEGTPLAEITFAHLEALPVNVARIDVRIEESESPADFVKAPGDIMRQYVASRFTPVGREGYLDIKVEQALVEKSYLEAENRVAKFMGFGGGDSYKVTYQIKLDYFRSSGVFVSGHVVKATRTINMSEHVSISQREKHQQEGIEKLFQELDRQIETIVSRDLNLVVKPAL